MDDRVQIVAVANSVALLLLVLELVRRRKLAEEYSILWIASAVVLLLISLSRETVHALARWIGVQYPPAALLLGLIGIVFVAALFFSVVASRQREQIERLCEEVAILGAEIRSLKDARLEVPPVPPPDSPSGAS
jgi:hypothetical protein